MVFSDPDLDMVDDPHRTCEECDLRHHEDDGRACPNCDIWVCSACWQDCHPCGRLSVRAWFRVQRRALWEADRPTYCTGRFAADLFELTEKVITHQPLDIVESLGDHRLLFNHAEWDRHESLLARIHQQMMEAMEEIDRELRRRAELDYMAKDLLS